MYDELLEIFRSYAVMVTELRELLVEQHQNTLKCLQGELTEERAKVQTMVGINRELEDTLAYHGLERKSFLEFQEQVDEIKSS